MFNQNVIQLLICLILMSNKCVQIYSLDNGLALSPPMGWLSWERFGCNTKCDRNSNDCISEKLFIQMADKLVSDGYKDAGYDRINIDDCWMQKKRSEDKQLLPDPDRFPNGIKFLSDYMHSKGLKLGIYQNYGLRTCMGFPGLIGFSELDAKTYAEWGVDMVKLDACFTPVNVLDKGYVEFGKYLNKTGRAMVYSCSWPYYQLHTSNMIPDWNSIAENCNLWRTYHDIHAKWKDILSTIDFVGDNQEIFNRNVGPGRWNDPDMLLIGNPGLNVEQSKVQMAIWALIAAPLFMSNDLRNIKKQFKDILLNKEVIAVNQDKLAIPGKRIFHNETLDIWLRPILPQISDGINSKTSFAIAFLNRRNNGPINITVKLKELGLTSSYTFRDLFDGIDLRLKDENQKIDVSIPALGIRLLKAQINDN